MSREFRGGYAAGIDDMKDMGPVDIVRVVEGDLDMSRLVYYHHHRRKDISEAYLEGWTQVIKDAHKKGERGEKMTRGDRHESSRRFCRGKNSRG